MKKILAILLTLVLAFQMTAVFATGEPNVALSSATGKAGETVSLTIDLSNCGDWTNVGIQLTYDTSKFTLNAREGITNEATASGAIFTKANAYNTKYNRFNMSWTTGEYTSYNGKLATLQFAIAEGVEPGTYPIALTYFTGAKGVYVDGSDVNYVDFGDGTGKIALGLTYTSGSITVEPAAPAGPTLSATCTDGKNVAIEATGVEAGGKFIAVLYDGNEMTDMVIADAAETATLTFLEGTGDQVKVMWWDSLTTLAPIAAPVEITVGN